MLLFLILVGYHVSLVASQSCNCGTSVINRIINGDKTTRGEYPWMAVLVKKTSPESNQCGAVLITKNYGVTAGHCTKSNPYNYQLLLGADNLKKQDSKTALVDVVKFVKYSSNRQDQDDDIALIKLATEVTFSRYIRPICLAQANEDYTGVEAVVMGYGATRRGSDDSDMGYSDVPLQGTVTVTSTKQCNRIMEFYHNPIRNNLLCAGSYNGEPDHCYGDSGGPLMYYDEETYIWRLIGIVSSAYECGNSHDYSFYANVSYFGDWLRENSDYEDC